MSNIRTIRIGRYNGAPTGGGGGGEASELDRNITLIGDVTGYAHDSGRDVVIRAVVNNEEILGKLALKQDRLTPGDNTSITDNVINADVPKFSTAQLAALDSGITSAIVEKINNHIADTAIHINGAERTAWNGKFTLPSGGSSSQYINGIGALTTFPTVGA